MLLVCDFSLRAYPPTMLLVLSFSLEGNLWVSLIGLSACTYWVSLMKQYSIKIHLLVWGLSCHVKREYWSCWIDLNHGLGSSFFMSQFFEGMKFCKPCDYCGCLVANNWPMQNQQNVHLNWNYKLTSFGSTKLSLFQSYGLWKRNAGLDGDAIYFVVNQARWQDRDQKI